jgi:predicted Asp-tRNA(Asn)/Glu-tRNA(Gln) amidotransferase subunit C
MLSEEKIRIEGLSLLAEFSRELEKVPETEETHYVVDLRNIVRPDGVPLKKEDFPVKFQKLVPKWEDGFVSVEKGV